MQFKIVKKVFSTPFRLATVSRRAVQAALILVVLASLVPAQLMAQNAIPQVNQPLVPTAAAPGGAAFTLTVNGTGFVTGAVVNWNGSPRVTTFVNSTQVTAAILATDINKAGTASVTVTNPAPGGGSSIPTLFPVIPAGTGVYMVRNDITVDPTEAAVATADFRSVGKTDVAIANSGNSVDVLLGNGDGTFAPAVIYPLTSGYPVAIIPGDFNGDGIPDLAVLLGHANEVVILTGKGDGTFTIGSQRFITGKGPLSLAAADVNNDGKLDLLVANFTDSTVSVLLGNGDGTFQPHQDYATGVNPEAVAVGDFNGDGLLDLAVANNNDNTVSVLLGTGGGAFASHVDYATAGAPTWVLTGDFNGDGKLDLAVCTASLNMSILLGHGDGTFAAQTKYPIGSNAQMAVAGDFNGDGKLDLADVNFGDNTVTVLQGVGNGTFKSQEVYPASAGPGWLALGDFNGDGKLDLAVADSSAGKLSVLTQTTLIVSPTLSKFAKQEGGIASAPQTVTLRNGSKTTVGIASMVIQGPNAADFSQTNTCGSSLGAGKTCTFSVTFTPQGMGTRSAQIVVTETNGTTFGAALVGTGTITITLTKTPHIFPATLVGHQGVAFTAKFQNYSNLTVTISSLGLTGIDPGDFVITSNACGSTVAPLTTCNILVAFKPTQAGGRTAGLTAFGGFSPGNGQQAIEMSGVGTYVYLSPTSLSFAAQAVSTTSAAQTVTVHNINPTSALSVGSVTIQGTNVLDFAQTNNCLPSIPAKGSCTINVTFTPQAVGARSAIMSIGDADPTGPQTVPLSGTGQ